MYPVPASASIKVATAASFSSSEPDVRAAMMTDIGHTMFFGVCGDPTPDIAVPWKYLTLSRVAYGVATDQYATVLTTVMWQFNATQLQCNAMQYNTT